MQFNGAIVDYHLHAGDFELLNPHWSELAYGRLIAADSVLLVVHRQNTNVKDQEDATVIDLQEPVSLSFALKYINSFAKATPLSPQVCFTWAHPFLSSG